ncbi:hypothetical protein BDB01DRAFT_835502 [Pilobolus umbonatus]|nr:hypothetical protein BDB01DRAFT_835502 [Pilobolus umbonatus]
MNKLIASVAVTPNSIIDILESSLSLTVMDTKEVSSVKPSANTVFYSSCYQECFSCPNSRLCPIIEFAAAVIRKAIVVPGRCLCPNHRGCIGYGSQDHLMPASRSWSNNLRLNLKYVAKKSDGLSTVDRHDLGSMESECCFCKAVMRIDRRCSTTSSRSPEYQLYCGRGQYVLDIFPSTPALISELLISNDERGKEFKQNIRSSNSTLSFTSLGAKLDLSVCNRTRGVYNFRIHGNIYHRIGTLLPDGNTAPSFAQIYIYDTTSELSNRHSHVPHTNITTLQSLQSMMHDINPFVRDFKTMVTLAQENGGEIEDVRMVFKAERTLDSRRYNAPTRTEIGVLILGNTSVLNSYVPVTRDIVVHLRNNPQHSAANNPSQLHRISEINECCDPRQYVVVFPSGSSGWNINSRATNGITEITALQFYSFHLMYRRPLNLAYPNINFHLHLFGRLYHMYANIEQSRLFFIRHNH